MFLRVYENTLVQQTEAELIAQGAVLAAVASADWPLKLPSKSEPRDLRPEPPRIDLSSTPVLPERPPPRPFRAWLSSGSPDAIEAARRLDPVLTATKRTTLASIIMLDANGLIVDGPSAGQSYAGLPEVARALGGVPTTVLRRNGAYRAAYSFEWLSRAAAIRVHHARPIVVGEQVVGIVLLSRSPRGLFLGIYQDRGKIAIGVVLIFLTLVGLAGLLSRGIARPIRQLTAASEHVARGVVDIPEPPVTAAVEIRDLFANFAIMAERIETRARYLRDFAAAVSHEFKTPLTGIRGVLELLGDHGAEMDEGERRRFLANATADADRLALLVQRLLDLARADMASGVDVPSCDPMMIAHEAAARVTTPDVTVAAAGPIPHVRVSADALATVLATLIENSRTAGARRVKIGITAGDCVMVRVADDGRGVEPADRARVFEPFFTANRAAGGTGLGLPIARSLLAATGGTIMLEDSASGATFVLTLPR